MKKVYILGLMACALSACKPNLSTQAPSKGSADFTTYLAVGNSLTAGYADNSLYLTGQQNSFPLRLSQQFATVGGGSFKQPLLTSDVGFPSPKLVLGEVTGCDGVTSLSPVPFNGPADFADSNNISAQGPFNNIGVPGIRCIDYPIPGYASIVNILGSTPYAYRFYDNPGTETPMDYLNKTIAKLNPTFFTCWMGNNDVLLYATGGGQGDNYLQSTNKTGFLFPGNISPLNLFTADYDSIVKALVKNGAKGALINIPDITSIPLCNTIPVNGLVLRQTQADSLNGYYAGTGMHFSAGSNYFVIRDHNNHIRQATSGEYILLTVPQDSIACYGYGSTVAIPAEYVLTSDEVANIQAAVIAYNNVISQAATTYGLAYVDMNAYLKTFVTGIVYNGVRYNAQYVTGGAFSLDGVHLTPRGYAIVANRIIDVINSKYGSTVPEIDVNKYGGIKFP